MKILLPYDDGHRYTPL